jgi:hypothetical protein
MRIIKVFLYALYAILIIPVSAILGLRAGRASMPILNRISPWHIDQQDLIDKKFLPKYFIVIGFSSKTGEDELLRLYDYSAEIKEAAASGLTKDELLREHGPIVFRENNGDYSYAVDPTKIESWNGEFVLDIEQFSKYCRDMDQKQCLDFALIKGTDDQEITLYTRGFGSAYEEFTYEVNNGHVTPIKYRNPPVERGGGGSVPVMFVVFLCSIAGLVVLGERITAKRKARAQPHQEK